jgi:excisionase family DNA binding protein
LSTKLLDRKELATHFGVSLPTVDRWIRDGIPALRPSPGVIRFDLADVIAWAKANAQDEAAV